MGILHQEPRVSAGEVVRGNRGGFQSCINTEKEPGFEAKRAQCLAFA